MAEYDDKSYYEVQLEQKQLVLILLLMVAICVLFFFLGVYYARGREPVMAGSTPRKEAPTPEALKAPEGPASVETEQVSRFFETGGSREGAAKAEYEGPKVIAESRPTDPKPRTDAKADAKGEGKPAAKADAGTPRPAPAPATPPRATPPREPAAPSAGGGTFIVQIGAMKDVERAGKVRDDLKAKGFKAYIETQDAGGGEKLYKVRVGPFADRTAADEARDALKAQGHGTAFVSGE